MNYFNRAFDRNEFVIFGTEMFFKEVDICFERDIKKYIETNTKNNDENFDTKKEEFSNKLIKFAIYKFYWFRKAIENDKGNSTIERIINAVNSINCIRDSYNEFLYNSYKTFYELINKKNNG